MGIVAGADVPILEVEVRSMTVRVHGLALISLALLAAPSEAEEWSRAKMRQLPDSAFAVVEIAPGGRRVRHLPHHDETGAVDRAHLRAAHARLNQVKWRDPADREVARHHLDEHRREIQDRGTDVE